MLTLLLLTAIKPADNAIDRFQNYMKKVQDLSVTLRMKVDESKFSGEGVLKVKRPKHFLYRMKWGPHDYSFSILGQDALAIERGSKVYREYPGGGFFIPEADISPVPDVGFPVALMAGSLRAMIPGHVSFKSDGRKEWEGVNVDQVSAKWSVQYGTIAVRAYIDSAGRLLGYDKEVKGPEAITVHMKISDYRLNSGIKESEYATPIPLGFVPETLPPDMYPLNIGEHMPWKGWKPLKGGKGIEAVAGKKVAFFAIAGENCDVSRRSVATVQALAKKIQAKGGVPVALSLGRAASQKPVYAALPTYFDPTGHAADDLRSPGTPMFLLVAANGRVTRIWYGFDLAKAGAFTSDVLTWVDKSKKPEGYFKFLDGG